MYQKIFLPLEAILGMNCQRFIATLSVDECLRLQGFIDTLSVNESLCRGPLCTPFEAASFGLLPPKKIFLLLPALAVAGLVCWHLVFPRGRKYAKRAELPFRRKASAGPLDRRSGEGHAAPSKE